MGFVEPNRQGVDAHGASARHSDPKTGKPGNYPHGLGGSHACTDAIRIRNRVRLVRGSGSGSGQ